MAIFLDCISNMSGSTYSTASVCFLINQGTGSNCSVLLWPIVVLKFFLGGQHGECGRAEWSPAHPLQRWYRQERDLCRPLLTPPSYGRLSAGEQGRGGGGITSLVSLPVQYIQKCTDFATFFWLNFEASSYHCKGQTVSVFLKNMHFV